MKIVIKVHGRKTNYLISTTDHALLLNQYNKLKHHANEYFNLENKR